MRVLILGGDGYLGWPTAMHLSARGHEITVVDNYLRRNLCRDNDCDPLFPVPNLHERVRLWKRHSGRDIEMSVGDLTNWEVMAAVVQRAEPEAIIHYAEQPAGPYSMLNRQAAALTLHNNLGVTFNLIQAVRAFVPEAHIVKLGTMGEYGTPNIDIEEGWIEIEHKGRRQKFLYPRQASSLYHTTKIMDTDLLWFYVRVWRLRVTDLMQGPVYGLTTGESEDDARLLPFLNYDEIFGTVLNRFIVQAVAGHPLTVYGKGSQTRGYLNIRDTLTCVRLAMEKPVAPGELRIFNQFTEVFSVNHLARRVHDVGRKLGLDVTIKSITNPRVEAEEHYYNPAHQGLLELGFTPTYLTDELLEAMIERVLPHRDNIVAERFLRRISWT
jgi:UDP-sulfoquinovose synthase